MAALSLDSERPLGAPACSSLKFGGILKILHIGPDSQFLQFLSGVFEAVAPGESRYLITSASSTEKLRFPVHADSVSVLARGVKGAMMIPMHVRSCDMIIAHGMGPYGVAAFLSSPRKTVRVWSGWGGDYYGDQHSPDTGLMSRATTALMANGAFASPRPSQIKSLANQMVAFAQKRAAKKADYFSAPIPSDLDIFKRRFNNFSGQYAQLNYGNVLETFSQGDVIGCGSNILVGNSASPTNNHIDVFHMLAKHDLGFRKVIVPLSYGDPVYRKNLMARGKEILGESFVPLVDFLPFDKYRSIVASCNVVVMNHFRQQALGNIGAALHQGAHVYLDIVNPIYKFFKEKGACVQTVQDLESNSLPLVSLSIDEVTNNRAVLEGFWGDDRIRANVENLLAQVRVR